MRARGAFTGRAFPGDVFTFRVRLLLTPVRAPLPASSYILLLAGARLENANLDRPHNPRLKPARPSSADCVAAARGLGAALDGSETHSKSVLDSADIRAALISSAHSSCCFGVRLLRTVGMVCGRPGADRAAGSRGHAARELLNCLEGPCFFRARPLRSARSPVRSRTAFGFVPRRFVRDHLVRACYIRATV